MPEHLHHVKIVGELDDLQIEFTCNGDRESECHSYPDCDCECWSEEHEEDHPAVKHDDCYLVDWFTSGGVSPCADNVDYGQLRDAGYTAGMEGPITATYQDEYVEWAFTEAVPNA